MEIASVAASALQSLANTQTPASTGAVKPEASAEAMARLEQAMNGPGADAQTSQTLPGQPGEGDAPQGGGQDTAQTDIAPVGETAAASSPGDAILRSLNRMSQGFENTVGQVNKSMSGINAGGAMNPAELMNLQFQLQQLSLQQDLTGKVASKATNSIDTFLKNQ